MGKLVFLTFESGCTIFFSQICTRSTQRRFFFPKIGEKQFFNDSNLFSIVAMRQNNCGINKHRLVFVRGHATANFFAENMV